MIVDIIRTLEESTVDEIAGYDIKNEWIDEIYCNVKEMLLKDFPNNVLMRKNVEELSSIEKMACYQISNVHIDCDVSLRTLVIFALAFPHVLREEMIDGTIISRRIREQGDKSRKFKICAQDTSVYEYRGDTMNSYNTTTHRLFNYHPIHGDMPEFLVRTRNGRLGVTEEYSKYKKHWEVCLLSNEDYFDKIFSENDLMVAFNFFAMNHTIGNFIPIPFVKSGIEFNRPRGCGEDIRDYWDITLNYIYKWYKTSEDENLLKIVKTEESMQLLKDWLITTFSNSEKRFCWDLFIEKNFLQSFVYSVGIKKYGEPKELWKGHLDFGAKVLPENNMDIYREFYRNSCDRICKRGQAIAERVKHELVNNENVRQIINDYIAM